MMRKPLMKPLFLLLTALMLLSLIGSGFAANVPMDGDLVKLNVRVPGKAQGIISQGQMAALLSMEFETGRTLLSLANLETSQLIRTQVLQDRETINLYEEGGFAAWQTGFLDDGALYAISLSLGQLKLYDRELNLVRDLSLPEDDLLYEGLVQGDGQAVWLGGYKGSLTRLSLIDGSVRQVDPGLPSDWVFSRFLGQWDGQVQALYTNEQGLSLLCGLDANGKTKLSTLRGDTGLIEGSSHFMQAGLITLLGRLPDVGNYRQLTQWQPVEYPLHMTDSLLLSGQYLDEHMVLRAYDTQNGLLLKEMVLPYTEDAPVYQDIAITGNDQVLFVFQKYEDDEGELYLWQLRDKPQNTDIGMVSVTAEQFAKGNDMLAQDIMKRHGIRVFIREQGIAFRDDYYQGQPSTSELQLRWCLSQLDAFLNSLPKDMIKEAILPPYKSLDVYLAGSIVQRGLDGISAPGGFTSYANDRRNLVLTTQSYNQLSSIAHEFMHIFEDRLQEYTNTPQGNNLLALWDRLGPKDEPDRGFVYRYTDDQGYLFGDAAYTANQYEETPNPNQVWFIDAYSRTFPIEDRSVLFEHSYRGAYSYDIIADYPHLQTKARALHALLRMAFPSVQAVDTAVWEQGFEKMSLEEMETLMLDGEVWEEVLPGVG